jgi:putative redox protein
MSTPAGVRAEYVAGDRLHIDVRGHELWSDQPLAEGGGDSAPTPTEIFLAGLAGCVVFYAERFLRRRGLSTAGLSVTCEYEWATSPLRVGAVTLHVEAPGVTAEQREAFDRVIERCPLHLTLEQPPRVRFDYAKTALAV